MTDCLSVIHHPVPDDIGTWERVSQMENVLHTEEVDIESIASGYLNIHPFCMPDIDCRLVGALVFHCCDEGNIESWTDVIKPHVYQDGPDTCVNLNCWEINPEKTHNEPELEWIPNPCKRLTFLRNCQMQWLKVGKPKSWSFRDSSGTKSFLSEDCLKEMIAEADSECDSLCGKNTRCMTFNCGTRKARSRSLCGCG